MKRGQAFETMMLVISVIVALAILGVLFSIIGGIGGVTGDPDQTITDGFKQLKAQGIGSQAPKVVQFAESQALYAKNYASSISVTEEEVEFFCEDTSVCGDDKAISIQANNKKIFANQKIDVSLVTCANEKNTAAPYYCVSIANSKNTKKATEICEEKCNLV